MCNCSGSLPYCVVAQNGKIYRFATYRIARIMAITLKGRIEKCK
jgi:hypothetical protein